MLKSKKILITGGLGFIGSNLAERCLALGAEVSLYDNLDSHGGGNLFNVADFQSSVKMGFHDILDFDRLVEYVVGQDIIFNCAASTSHPFSMREPWLDLDVNSRGVINLLEAIRRFNPSARFVHVGTTTQFGRLHYRPADEFHPEFPMDMYSANKGVSEKYVLLYSNAHGLSNTVVRLSNVFGPRASIHSPEFTFNNFFAGLALQGKDITVFGDGAQMRNAVYVDDAVNALIAAATSEAAVHETFLAVHDDHFSVAQIAEATMEHLGSGAVKYVAWPPSRRSIEIGDAVMTNAKIRRLLDWQPEWSLVAGLKKTREYFADRLHHYIK